MNHCAIQQNSFAACEEIWATAAATAAGRAAENKERVVCPKPRRLGRPLRWHVSHHQQEDCDLKAGNEVLDIILAKGGLGSDQSSVPQVASSPPFFSGSPPSRVSNPLIQDARFGDEKSAPISPRAIPIPFWAAGTISLHPQGGWLREVGFWQQSGREDRGFRLPRQGSPQLPHPCLGMKSTYIENEREGSRNQRHQILAETRENSTF